MAFKIDSKVLEPDLILSSDGKEILFCSDFERLEREKRFIDFLALNLCDFLRRG